MKEIEINIKRKTKLIKRPELFINLFTPSRYYCEKKEITYEQPYVEILFKADESLSNEEKKQIIDLFIEKINQEKNFSFK
jgi:hypothetical protein